MDWKCCLFRIEQMGSVIESLLTTFIDAILQVDGTAFVVLYKTLKYREVKKRFVEIPCDLLTAAFVAAFIDFNYYKIESNFNV